jgi:GNAT superfamily N-acetyltransferase
MQLVTAVEATREHIMSGTYPIWGEGLSREAYSRWNRGQMATDWGREHLRRVALVDESGVLASAKRYDFRARVDGLVTDILGVGAVFTPPELRGRGHARDLIDAMIADAADRGCSMALLFSEIGASYYEPLGFRAVPRRQLTIEVAPFTGSPATLVRSGEREDLPIIAEISARYAAGAAFALERTPDLIGYSLARKRLLAGLGPDGLREVEFFVAEEAFRAAAYVVITRGPRGRTLEECGDRDPTGARVGAMLQVLSARTPAEPPLRLIGWLPDSLRPPQLRVVADDPAPEIMMWRPIAGPAPDRGEVVFWPIDTF